MQRVYEASVEVDGDVTGAIADGLLVYLGVGKNDGVNEIDYMVRKVSGLRIFGDDEGKMSRSVLDTRGGVLVVSQFTLFGDVRKGRRPSFTAAGPPGNATQHYQAFVEGLRAAGVAKVETGVFQAHMHVQSVGNGPVTILIDSEKTF